MSPPLSYKRVRLFFFIRVVNLAMIVSKHRSHPPFVRAGFSSFAATMEEEEEKEEEKEEEDCWGPMV